MSQKTILITGASSGIGKATAKYFHENGWNVVATMRRPEQEEELKANALMLCFAASRKKLAALVTNTSTIPSVVRIEIIAHVHKKA